MSAEQAFGCQASREQRTTVRLITLSRVVVQAPANVQQGDNLMRSRRRIIPVSGFSVDVSGSLALLLPGQPRTRKRSPSVAVLALAALSAGLLELPRADAQVSVLTYHNDNARTGQNLNETVLTLASVNKDRFGKLFSRSVDGYVYAQPLYLPNVAIPGRGRHNVVLVATEHDSVYAFDADTNAGDNANPLWKTTFINPQAGITTLASADIGFGEIVPEVGITGTPVIDATTGTLYVVAQTKENGRHVHRLHALDVATGQEKRSVEIQATVPGSADGESMVSFDPSVQLQRPGLLLLNGVVYAAWGSYGDLFVFHGWLMGYDASTLRQVAVFNVTPNGDAGSIWQSGAAPAADASGDIYVETANGTFGTDSANFGDSALRLRSGGGRLVVRDYFTPFDQATLEADDADLGAGGPLLLPDQPGAHPHLLVAVGKAGTIYLLDRDNLGRFHAGDDSQIVQSIIGFDGVFGMPAYWNKRVYILGTGRFTSGDVLHAFALVNGLLSATPVDQTSTSFGYPGAVPAISANGSTNGILWAIQVRGFRPTQPAVLHAYDATNLSVELYNSGQAGERDNPGDAVKFTVPTVANGKVYVGTQSQLSVFGLLASFSLSLNPESQTVNAGVTATYTLTLTPVPGFNGTVSLSCSGAPPAAACSVSPSSITLDGTNPSTATVTVNTTARLSAVPGRWPPVKAPLGNVSDVLRWVLLSLVVAALGSLAGLWVAGRRAWPRLPPRLGGTILILVVLIWIACGGGARRSDPGTPAGTYTLTIAGVSGSSTENVTGGLTVQ